MVNPAEIGFDPREVTQHLGMHLTVDIPDKLTEVAKIDAERAAAIRALYPYAISFIPLAEKILQVRYEQMQPDHTSSLATPDEQMDKIAAKIIEEVVPYSSDIPRKHAQKLVGLANGIRNMVSLEPVKYCKLNEGKQTVDTVEGHIKIVEAEVPTAMGLFAVAMQGYHQMGLLQMNGETPYVEEALYQDKAAADLMPLFRSGVDPFKSIIALKLARLGESKDDGTQVIMESNLPRTLSVPPQRSISV